MAQTPTEKNNRASERRSRLRVESTFGATDLWLLLVMLIWGSNFTVVKVALDQLQPMAFTVLRFLIASAMMLVIARMSGRGLKAEPSDWRRLFGLSLLGNVLYQFFFIYGVQKTRAGNASMILATAPLFTAVIGRIRGQEYFSARGIAGLLLAFLGIIIIIVGGHAELAFDKGLLGDTLLIGATVCWSLYTVWAKRFVHLYGALKATTIMMITGTPVLLAASIPSLATQDWSRVDALGWAGVAFSGMLAIALAYLLWNQGVRKIGPTRTAVYSNLTPVVAVLVAWPVLAEVPTVGQVAGAVIIFVGIYLVRGGMVHAAPEKARREEIEEISLRPGEN